MSNTTIQSVLNKICESFIKEGDITMDTYEFTLLINSLNIKLSSWYTNEATITIIELTEKKYSVVITSGNHEFVLTIDSLDEIKTYANTIYVLFHIENITPNVIIKMVSMDCIEFKGYCDVSKCINLKDGYWKMFNNSTVIGMEIGNNSVIGNIRQIYGKI